MTQTAVSTQSHGLGLDMVSLLYHKDIKAKTKSLAFSKLALWKGRMLLHDKFFLGCNDTLSRLGRKTT